MCPLPHLPVTSIRSSSGTSVPHGARTWTRPLRTVTSSASTTMPGLVISVMCPLRTSASMCSIRCTITASVKSSVMWPLETLRSIRFGTTQRPRRSARPLEQCSRIRSFGAEGATTGDSDVGDRDAGDTAVPAAGRSATSAASSAYVRAVSASSSRSSSSSGDSRPSPAATRSCSTTRSRSACDARSVPGALGALGASGTLGTAAGARPRSLGWGSAIGQTVGHRIAARYGRQHGRAAQTPSMDAQLRRVTPRPAPAAAARRA